VQLILVDMWSLCQTAWNRYFWATVTTLPLLIYLLCNQTNVLVTLSSILAFLAYIRRNQACKMQFYTPAGDYFKACFESTGLREMKYTPSLWTLTKTLQTLVFGLIEAYEICFPVLRYQRELLGLADGG
jgi:hypothetical protein